MENFARCWRDLCVLGRDIWNGFEVAITRRHHRGDAHLFLDECFAPAFQVIVSFARFAVSDGVDFDCGSVGGGVRRVGSGSIGPECFVCGVFRSLFFESGVDE